MGCYLEELFYSPLFYKLVVPCGTYQNNDEYVDRLVEFCLCLLNCN